MGVASAILIILITIICRFFAVTSRKAVRFANMFPLVPPIGVYAVAGCGMGKSRIPSVLAWSKS